MCTTTRRPVPFASYIAVSASRRSVSALDAGRGTGVGDADAGSDEHLATGDMERLRDRLEDPPGDVVRVRFGIEVLGEDRELVAAQTSDGVAGSHEPLQPTGDLHEHGVPDRVTERVVDGLEPVEVDEDQGDEVVLVALSALQGMLDPFEHE